MNGRTTQYEFSAIRRDSSGIHLTPFPGGRRSEHDFTLTDLANTRAVFQAPEHDFPKRIIYRREGTAALRARIDGGEGDSGTEWLMARAACLARLDSPRPLRLLGQIFP